MNRSTHSQQKITQEERHTLVMCALWFSAIRYEPDGQRLLASLDVREATQNIIAMLDDLELLSQLPTK